MGPDGESLEPLPVPVRGIHPAWFVVAIAFGLALTAGFVVLLNRSQPGIGGHPVTWPTPTPYFEVRDITREPTLVPIVTSGTRLLALTSENASRLAHVFTFPDPIGAAHFGTSVSTPTVDLIQHDSWIHREIYSSWSYDVKLERAFSSPVAFSTDPNVMATGGTGKNILLWNIQRGAVDMELPPLNAQLTALTFSGNGMLLAGGDAAGGILIWNVFSGAEQATLDVGGAVQALRYDRSGEQLVVASVGYPVRIYSGGQVALELPIDGTAAAVVFSPDERFLVYNDDSTIYHLEFGDSSARRVLAGHMAPVTALGFSADGQLLASGDRDGRIFVWDMASRTMLTTVYLASRRAVSQLEFNTRRGQSTLLVARDDAGLASLWGVVETD